MKRLAIGSAPFKRRIGLGVTIVIAIIVASAVTSVAAAAEAQDDIEQGKILFESRCPVCHQLPEPSMLKLSQWRRLLTTMQKRIQQSGMPPLSEPEFQQVLDYLATQARD